VNGSFAHSYSSLTTSVINPEQAAEDLREIVREGFTIVNSDLVTASDRLPSFLLLKP
jgi:hypothetical protein